MGCDSIVTLILKVNDPIEVEEYVNICYGESYTFGSQTITETCDVRETFKTADVPEKELLVQSGKKNFKKVINKRKPLLSRQERAIFWGLA